MVKPGVQDSTSDGTLGSECGMQKDRDRQDNEAKDCSSCDASSKSLPGVESLCDETKEKQSADELLSSGTSEKAAADTGI